MDGFSFSQFQQKGNGTLPRPVLDFASSSRFATTSPTNVQEAKPKRKPRARKLAPAAAPHDGTLTIVADVPQRRKRASRKVEAHAKDKLSYETIHLNRNLSEQHMVNQFQETVTHYGPDGQKLIETTRTRHEEQRNLEEEMKMEWTRQKVERERTFSVIENYTLDECKQKSHGFGVYERKIIHDVKLFKQKIKMHLNGDISRAWRDASFIKRFLFGLSNEWEPTSQPNAGDVPWLACLWTMKEMLQLCNDLTWISEFCGHSWNSCFYTQRNLPERLFCVNQQMMCGYVTGQLLAHTMPILHELMRDEVRQETLSSHFPIFAEYILDNDGPPMLLLRYDFHDVDAEVPSRCARDCAPSNTCCVFGIEADTSADRPGTNTRKHVFCDALFVRLLSNKSIRDSSSRTARNIACDMEPKIAKKKDIDDMLELL